MSARSHESVSPDILRTEESLSLQGLIALSTVQCSISPKPLPLKVQPWLHMAVTHSLLIKSLKCDLLSAPSSEHIFYVITVRK